MQFGSLIMILIALLASPSRYGDDRFFYLGLGGYLLAKLFEYDDRPIYDAAQVVSDHTIKHLMAAVGL